MNNPIIILLLLILLWVIGFSLLRVFTKNSYITKNKDRYERESKRCPSCGSNDLIFRKEVESHFERHITNLESFNILKEDLICSNCKKILLLPPSAEGKILYDTIIDKKFEVDSENWYDSENGNYRDVEKQISYVKPTLDEITVFSNKKLEYDSKNAVEKKAVAIFLTFQTIIIFGIIFTLRLILN